MPVSSDDRGVNPLKVKFFDAVACLEASLTQFNNVLDQCG
jgi:hypothetical protein